jgi:transcriptional regulator GlxA family with amidase domain
MRIAVLTFDGFNEVDSFVASAMLNRLRRPDWRAEICAPAETVTSLNGVRVERQQPLAFAREADAVIVGSGRRTREIVEDAAIMSELRFDVRRQIIASQCSGALILSKLGLVREACTDDTTRPWVIESGCRVLDRPLHVAGNVATAGGCFASQYLAMWLVARGLGIDVAVELLAYFSPIGERDAWSTRAVAAIAPYL